MTAPKPIPERALELFDLYAAAAPNWNGCPLLGSASLLGGARDRGLLTHLKRVGLLETERDDEGTTWVYFTDAGKALAAARGIAL